MPRYLIIGCSGSGKSTLARQLSVMCNNPYINTDKLYWRSDWSVVPEQEVVKAIDLKAQDYVLDGNFDRHRAEVWRKADVIVWLDYNLLIILYRVFSRNMRWWLNRYSPWTGTPMSFYRALAGVRHSFRSYRKKRKSYPAYLAEFSSKKIYIVSSRREIPRLLNDFISHYKK